MPHPSSNTPDTALPDQSHAALVSRVAKLEQDLSDLQVIHEVTLVHSDEIEDEVRQLADELEVRNRFIRDVFGRYMDDTVVDTLLDSPEALAMGGARCPVTILMSDLRGFTAMCERLSPEQVVRTLNIYLGVVASLVESHGGWINEFTGDGVLAVFGAPVPHADAALRAVSCAAAMQLAIPKVNADLAELGLPALAMGVGLHSGEVVVGNIGSERRAKFGLVGTPVNVTSRIESYTVGGQVLLSKQTLDQLADSATTRGSFEATPKGVRGVLHIYDLADVSWSGQTWSLPDPLAEELHPLVVEAPIRAVIVDGKDVGSQHFIAMFIRLGSQLADVRADRMPRAMQNLKFNLLGTTRAEDNYAKVVRTNPEDGTFQVRFTSVAPPVRDALEALVRAD